jgi:hypothetical protein
MGEMRMDSFSFWQRWLLAVGILILGFGLLMALAAGTPLFDFFNRQIDPAFWSGAAVESTARQFQHWIYGVWGATIAGWGIFLVSIIHYPFSRKEAWAWECVAVGLVVWFVLDTSLSIYYGVFFNAAFNSLVLVAAAPPLMLTRKKFH